MQRSCSLCLLSLAMASFCAAQNDFGLSEEDQLKNFNIDENSLPSGTVTLKQEGSEKLDEVSVHRQGKPFAFHRPGFLGENKNKVEINSHPTKDIFDGQQKVQMADGFVSDLREDAAFEEKNSGEEQNGSSQNKEQLFLYVPKLTEKEAPHSGIHKGLNNILNSLQKREVNPARQTRTDNGSRASHADNLIPSIGLSDEIYESLNQKGYNSKERQAQESLLEAKIRDLANQMLNDPKSKLICEKSDLELLHDIIDGYKDSRNENNGKKLKSFDTVSLQESSFDEADESVSGDSHRSGSLKTRTKSAANGISQKETNKEEGIDSFVDLDLESHQKDSRKIKPKSEIREFSPKEIDKEEIFGSPLNSNLDRIIQEAAEKIGLWVNSNFDTTNGIKKTKLKGDLVKKEHKNADISHNSNDDAPDGEEALRVNSGCDTVRNKVRVSDGEVKKAAAIKMLLHPKTAKVPESEVIKTSGKVAPEAINHSNTSLEFFDSEFEDTQRKNRKNKGSSKLNVGEVRKAKLTTLPPCGRTRKPDHGKCECTNMSIQNIDPKLLDMLCSKSATTTSSKSPCIQSSTRLLPTTPSTTRFSTRKTRIPITASAKTRPMKIGNNAELIDKNTVLIERIVKQLVNESFKNTFKDNLVGERNNTRLATGKMNSNNLSDILHLLLNTAEPLTSTMIKNDEASSKPVAPSECVAAMPRSDGLNSKNNFRTDHLNKSSKRLTHFVNLAAVENEQTKKLAGSTTPVDELNAEHATLSSLKALSSLLDLIRRQSSETVSSHKSLLGDQEVNEKLRMKPNGNDTVALNVFIKAAIIPDLKNASQKHEMRGSYLSSVKSVDKAESGAKSRVDTTALKDTVSEHFHSHLSDNTLGNLLKSIIVKARFQRQSEPRVSKSVVTELRHLEE